MSLSAPRERAAGEAGGRGEAEAPLRLGLAGLFLSRDAALLFVGLLLAACWTITFVLGGAGRVAPHWFYLPILFSAARVGRGAAVITALAAGALAGPLMPLDVQAGTPQALSDWVSRAIFFVVIGSLMAIILGRHHRAERRLQQREAELETLRAIDLSILGVAPFDETLGIARKALDTMVWADRLGLIIRDAPLGTVRRLWVTGTEQAHEIHEPEPANGPLALALGQEKPVSGMVDPDRSSWEMELASEGLRSFVAVPFAAEGDVIGALTVSSRRREPFPPSEVETAERIATQLTLAFRAVGLRSEIARRVAELEAIKNVSEAVGASLELTEVLGAALDRSLEATAFELGWVSVEEADTGELVLAAGRNLRPDVMTAASRLDRAGPLGQVVADGRPRLLREIPIAPGFPEHTSPGFPMSASLIAIPLHAQDRAIGLFVLGSLDGGVPTAEDFRLAVALARPIAAAVGNARLHERMQHLEGDRRRLLSQLVSAQEEERKRLAIDLHDDAVQVMAALAIRLDMLRETAEEPQMIEAVDKAASSAREAVARLRHMLFELHPPALEREGLAATIGLTVRELAENTGIDAVFDAAITQEPSPERRVVLYRIAQEALTNVRKHARARRVDVRLEERDGGFAVEVADDGEGFAPDDPGSELSGHLGLQSMRERARFADGWCEIDSAPGRGTTVRAWIPASDGENEEPPETSRSS